MARLMALPNIPVEAMDALLGPAKGAKGWMKSDTGLTRGTSGTDVAGNTSASASDNDGAGSSSGNDYMSSTASHSGKGPVDFSAGPLNAFSHVLNDGGLWLFEN